MQTEELFKLRLKDGLPTMVGETEHRYHAVELRETTVGDERKAVALAERVVNTGQGQKLMVSEETYTAAITMLSIKSFKGDADRTLKYGEITLANIDKLSSGDWKQIEERVFFIDLTSKLRHGDLTEKQYKEYLKALKPSLGQSGLGESQGKAKDLDQADNQSKPAIESLAPRTRDNTKKPANTTPG